MMTSSEDAVEEENNDALWRLFRNAGAFSGGVCRDVVERHVLPSLNRNDVNCGERSEYGDEKVD